jgi:hypothetical protein
MDVVESGTITLIPVVPVSCCKVKPLAGKDVPYIVAILPDDTVFQYIVYGPGDVVPAVICTL